MKVLIYMSNVRYKSNRTLVSSKKCEILVTSSSYCFSYWRIFYRFPSIHLMNEGVWIELWYTHMLCNKINNIRYCLFWKKRISTIKIDRYLKKITVLNFDDFSLFVYIIFFLNSDLARIWCFLCHVQFINITIQF